MNKAFVREAEQAKDCCPRCGSEGEVVEPRTVAAHVAEPTSIGLTGSPCYCPSERCPVVYFDSLGRDITTEQLKGPVYPKDPEAPICPCFQLMRADIDQDVDEGVATRTRAILEKSKTAEAHCELASANGRSCVPHVQKYFMQRKKND